MSEARTREATQQTRRRRDPEGSKKKLLEAATIEFSTKGLEGARIDEIARRAGVNKQLVYHHFGSKDELYLKVLELSYERFRARDEKMDLENLPPEQAVAALVRDTFDGTVEQKNFAALVVDENLHGARHVRRSRRLKRLHQDLIARLQRALDRGIASGVFRPGADAFQLYVSIASLAAFYCTNKRTLSALFNRDLGSRTEIELRRAHIVDLIISALRP